MRNPLFIVGGSGFIGAPFVEAAVGAGYHVQALARTEQSAEVLRQRGADPVQGDLITPGPWQQTAANADYVVHLAQPPTFEARVSLKRAQNYQHDRIIMDQNLLGALNPDRVKRIVYVSGTSFYGDVGEDKLYDETATPKPMGWGPYVVEALRALSKYAHLPIVEAFPGGVYGPGSWFGDVLKLLDAKKILYGISGPNKYNSYIHYEDCARGILHLLECGQPGQRYFLVDNQPATALELVQFTIQAMGVPLRTRLLPAFLLRIIVGPVVTESLQYRQRLTNVKLRQTGFEFKFPTLAEGVPDVVTRWHRSQ